jgi:hypothetical protein
MTSNCVEKEEREVRMKRKESSNGHYYVTTTSIWQARATELRHFSKDSAGLKVYTQYMPNYEHFYTCIKSIEYNKNLIQYYIKGLFD